MTSTMRKPILESLSQPPQGLQQNSIRTSYGLDVNPYSDPTLLSSDSCDSTLPSPTSPYTLTFPSPPYALPKEEFNPNTKTEQAFNFGTFEDWMRWDDPNDAALSPTSDYFPDLKLEPSSPTMSGLELQGSGVGTIMNDDSVMFGGDSLSEAPLFQTLNAIPNERENLYSTPLSWARPTPNRNNGYMTTLSPHQEVALRNIAMPSQPFPGSASSNSSPEPQETTQTRKRKPSLEDEDLDHDREHDHEDADEDDGSPSNGRNPPVKKTAHNMIEKRYRTNLNDKIAALRDSVPSLRVMSKKNSRSKNSSRAGGGCDDREEDLQGLTPAHKLNKATVLSKATEYIAHLEKRNRGLLKENEALKARVDAFEILVMARQQQQGSVMQQQQQQRMRQLQQQQQFAGGMSGMM